SFFTTLQRSIFVRPARKVFERRARKQAQRVLSCKLVEVEDLRRLREHLEEGLVDGQETRTCFFGVLSGNTVGGYRRLRDFVGMESVVDS
ncbi:hypothetical protein DD876_13125, partial [Staphylococcus pseudintermedius]